MSLQSVPVSASESSVLDVGAVLGGRFALEEHCNQDVLETVFRARDAKTGKSVAIRVLHVDDPAAVEVMRERVKAAAKLRHRNLAAIYGLGSHAGSARYLAEEWVQGKDLQTFVHEHLQTGTPISLRGAYNLVAHACKALSALHPNEFHGALRPSVVIVSRNGRVKITELGLSRALVESGYYQYLPAEDLAFIAPEIRAGGQATAAADIFGLGALLYVMLTGRSPADAFVMPSQVHAEASPAVDQLLMRCLAPHPAERFASAEEVTAAMLALVTEAPDGNLELDELHVEVDVDIATSLAPRPPSATAARISSAPPPPPRQASHSGRISSAPPGLPARNTPDPAPPTPAPHPTAGGLDQLIEQLTRNDAPKWMPSKDGMDHGPFTTRELIKMIVEGEVLADHNLFHVSRNERKPLKEYTEFSEFIAQYDLRKAEKDHQAALKRSETVEKHSNRFKVLVFSLGIGAIAVAGGFYVVSRQQGSESENGDVDLAAAYGDGQVKIKGTAGVLKDARRGGAFRKRAGGSGTGFGSYEDAMNQAIDMGDATRGGGERQLRREDVAGTMNRHLNSLASCPGGGGDSIRIDLAIQGSGDVMGATVSGGSPAFKQCLVGKIKRIKFPGFPAPRMGARYSFKAD